MQRSNRGFWCLLAAAGLLAAVAVQAATVGGSTWLASHWSTGGGPLTSWYTTSVAYGLGANESIVDVNLVVEHDHDNNPMTPIQWEEFTATSLTKSSSAGWGSKTGTSQTYSVTGYDDHHHQRVNNQPVVQIKERVYIYDSGTGVTTPYDGPAVWGGCS